MKRLHLLLYMVLACIGMQAQEEGLGEQLLVFRNTGVVDLLFTNEVDSIVTYDTEQVFYVKDTVIVVPIAELDSVAVGNRNVRQLNAQVRELTEERDLSWLIRTEGNHLYYRIDTPQDILPKQGEKLFYGNIHELLPTGLSARVLSVTAQDNEQDVEIEPIELHEIFDKFFYAGRVTMSELPAGARFLMPKKADTHEAKVIPIEGSLPVGEYGEINSKSELNLVGDFVINAWAHYYHAHIKGEYNGEAGAKLKCDSNTEWNDAIPLLHLPLPTVAGVLYPSVFVNLFTDFKAELNMNFTARRVYRFEYDWTRNDGEQRGEVIPPTEGETNDDEIQADLTLNGELHLGVQVGIGLNLIGNTLGFRFDAKMGPYFEGEIGIGVLGKMRNYDSGLWHKAELSGSIKLKFGLSYLRHEIFYIFGNEVVTPISSLEFNLFKQTLYLFPEYEHTNAVAQTKQTTGNAQKTDVNTATALPKPPLTNIETGFEIVNPQGEVVDSAFVGTILAEPEDTTVAQTFEAEIPLPQTIQREDLEDYTVHPIFHYAGYTISAAPVGIKKDVLLQPYTSTQSDGAMTFISSGPFLDSAVADTTLYFLGTWMPVPLKHNVYQESLPNNPKVQGKHIDKAHADLLIGAWKGIIGDEEVTIVFSEDGTGTYGERTFTYEVNKPQSGCLLLTFEGDETLVLLVLSITETELKLKNRRDMQQQMIELNRIAETLCRK